MSVAPVVSIIIPVYNVEKYLRRCLDSVLNQTFENWQAICINDGSTDSCAKILDEYAARDSRINVITKQNGGLSDARNVGVAAATGEYILFLDSDDFIHPQTMEIALHFATENRADMVSFGYDIKFHKKLRRLMRAGRDISNMMPEKRNVVYKIKKIPSFVTENILSHSTEYNHTGIALFPVRRHCFPVLCLYRRELIADIPFIKGIIMEDFPWWSAVMLRRPRTVLIKVPLYFYMPNPDSILSSAKALRMIESITAGLQYVYELYRRDGTEAEFLRFNREFLWPFVIIAARKVRDLTNPVDVDVARCSFETLYNMGVFDCLPNLRARRYLYKIKKFIDVK